MNKGGGVTGTGTFTCSNYQLPNDGQNITSSYGTTVPANSKYRVTILSHDFVYPSSGPAQGSTSKNAPGGGSSSSWNTYPAADMEPTARAIGTTNGSAISGYNLNLPPPTGPDRLVYVEYWQRSGSGTKKDPYVWTYQYFTQADDNCYSASCSFSAVTADAVVPGSPTLANPIQASSGFTVNVTITNTGKASIPMASADNAELVSTGDWGGSNFIFLNYAVGSGQSVTQSFHGWAPGSEGAYTLKAQPEYNGNPWLGAACSTPVNAYSYFDMRPTASFDSNNNWENPNPIYYHTGVQVVSMPNPPGSITNQTTSTMSGPTVSPTQTFIADNAYSTTVSTSYTYSNPAYNPLDVQQGQQYCVSMTVQYTQGWVSSSDIDSTPSTPNTASDCHNVVNEPYVHYYGNDVIAGAGFGPQAKTCTPDAGGDINTYNNNGAVGYGYSGSGSQFGAFALALVDGFVSADQRGTIPTAPKGLTFANTSGGYGGNFGSAPQDYCADDYFGDFFNQQNVPAYSMIGSFIGGVGDAGGVGGSAGSHDYLRNGDLQVNGLTMQNGVNATVFVNGNVYISNDITYAGANGGWFSVNDVPSLFIVTSPGHNIYVSNTVGQMDGVYVAEPNGPSGGSIDTCNDSTGSLSFNGSGNGAQYAYCAKQLIVNGSFVARKIELHRTFSSLRYAQPGENLGTAVHDCGTKLQDGVTEAKGAECAAEVFNFSPELYLSLPSIEPYGGPTRQTFDAYDSLPPIL